MGYLLGLEEFYFVVAIFLKATSWIYPGNCSLEAEEPRNVELGDVQKEQRTSDRAKLG